MDRNRVRGGAEALSRLAHNHGWLLCAIAVVALAVAVRFLLFHRFPIFFTNDSNDYLRASERIAVDLDFLSRDLRDWRLPGYPVFLAGLWWLTPWTSTSVVAVQKAGGVLCVIFGLAAARSLGWRVGALLVGVFLALHPVYLLNEHLAMSEALFTLLLWAFTALSVATLGRSVGVVRGLLVGGALSLCVLTRSPGLFWCAPVLAGFMIYSLARAQGQTRARFSALLPFISGLLVAMAAIIGPWTYRNYLLYGKLNPLTNNVERTLVGYLAIHDVLDPDLPEVRPFTRDRDENPALEAGRLIRRLGSGPEGEERAGRIVREQIRKQKGEYLRHVGYSLIHFLGFPETLEVPGGRGVSHWFNGYVKKPTSFIHLHNSSFLNGRMTLAYVEIGRYGRVVKWWAGAGLVYLRRGRALLTLAFVVSLVAYLLTGGLKVERREQAAVLALVVGFISVAVCHSLLLAGKERYAVPWDGFQILVIAGVLEHVARQPFVAAGRRWVVGRLSGEGG